MNERGNRATRTLDFWAGIPLVGVAGAVRRISRGGRRIPETPRSVAVLCFAAIGDLLLASVVVNALRAALPHATIYLYASKANADALALLPGGCTPRVHDIGNLGGIIKSLRKDAVDILFDTTQWARIGAVLSLFSGTRFTVGFDTPGQYRGSAYDIAVPHRQTVHETENFLELARAVYPEADASPSIAIKDIAPEYFAAMGLTNLSRTVFLHMWASGNRPAVKEWDPAKWAELARACAEAGYTAVLTGSPADAGKNDEFLATRIPATLRKTGRIRSIAGGTGLAALAWLFNRSAAVVSVNTGIVHLAGLAGARVIDLHGPTTPARWGACGPGVHHLTTPDPRGGYLNLGFEFPENAPLVLHALPVPDVLHTLNKAGLDI